MTNILYLDLETTINNKGDHAIGKHQASPFHPDNRIVWLGYMWEGFPVQTKKETTTRRGGGLRGRFASAPDVRKGALLVAQNVSFDLAYLMTEDPKWLSWVKDGGQVWDTMIVEYLLTGQKVKWASLDHLSTKYGGTLKDNRMKEYWKAGTCTSDIPDDEIQPYLADDVSNLQIIYKAQLKEAKRLGMLPLIESQMTARVATIMMEYNGMHFDEKIARIEAASLRVEYNVIEQGCKAAMAVVLNELSEDEINPNSNVQVAACLFGGEMKVVRKVAILDEEGKQVKYKSGLKKGTFKFKNTDMLFYTDGLYKAWHSVGANGSFPVGNDVLNKLKDNTGLVENILKLREYKKQLSTYFEGYSKLVFPDGMIHGSLNHCQTNTGRLSSSQPNLQNISNKESGDDT